MINLWLCEVTQFWFTSFLITNLDEWQLIQRGCKKKKSYEILNSTKFKLILITIASSILVTSFNTLFLCLCHAAQNWAHMHYRMMYTQFKNSTSFVWLSFLLCLLLFFDQNWAAIKVNKSKVLHPHQWSKRVQFVLSLWQLKI